MPHPRRADRPEHGGGDRRPAGGQRAVPVARRARRARLADKHGTERLEAACGKAIAVGDPSYRTVKGILAAGAEADPPPAPAGDGGAAAFLHGPQQLFGNVVALPGTDHTNVADTDTSDQRDRGGDDEPDAGVSA